MSKRLILKLLKQLFKKYAYVEKITEEDNVITITLQPYSHYEDSL